MVPHGTLTLPVHPAGCWSVLYMGCYTCAVIRLSAKHWRRQTRLTVAVFISCYVTLVTLDLFLSVFVDLLLRVTSHQFMLWLLIFAQDWRIFCPNIGLIHFQVSHPCGQQSNPSACWLCLETKPIKRVWIMRVFQLDYCRRSSQHVWRAWHHQLSQNTRTKPTVDSSPSDTAFLLCWSSSLFSAPPDQRSGKLFVCTPPHHDKLTVAHWLCG